MDYKLKEFTGKNKNGYYITALGKKIFLYNPRNTYVKYDIIVNENTLHITDSFYLPLRYGKITIREYEELKKTYTEEEAEYIAKARLKRYFDRLSENGVYITENNVTIRYKDNKCIAEGRILVEEPAWEYQVINESEWRIEQTDEHN
jgi:similar to stage IV sporulation protein